MTYSSISIPAQSLFAPFDTFEKLLSFCLSYENKRAASPLQKASESQNELDKQGGFLGKIEKQTNGYVSDI